MLGAKATLSRKGRDNILKMYVCQCENHLLHRKSNIGAVDHWQQIFINLIRKEYGKY
jgi:hypothetical protein